MSTTAEQIKLKNNLETLIRECYKRAGLKNFKDLNFVFPDNITKKKYFERKIAVFNKLDIYSQTFLSIHTRGKIALREFNEQKFEGAFLELIRNVLTLNENLIGKKSIGIRSRHELDEMIVGKEITIVEVEKNNELRSNTRLLQSGIKGKSLKNKRTKENFTTSDLMDIEFTETNNYKTELMDMII